MEKLTIADVEAQIMQSRSMTLGDLVDAVRWAIANGPVRDESIRVALNRLLEDVMEREQYVSDDRERMIVGSHAVYYRGMIRYLFAALRGDVQAAEAIYPEVARLNAAHSLNGDGKKWQDVLAHIALRDAKGR